MSSTRRRRLEKATQTSLAVLAYTYSKAKVSIDLSDQMASYVATTKRGVKSYRKLGIELLLGMSIVNAWVMCKHISHKKIDIRTFREQQATGLLNIDELQELVKKLSNNIHLLSKRVNKNYQLI